MGRKKVFFPGIFLAAFFSLVACVRKESWHKATFLYFDTVCEVELFGSPAVFRSSQNEADRIFSQVETLFSPGKIHYSSPMAVSLFHRAFDVYESSWGCFDITIAPLSRAWGFWDKNFRIPAKEEIQALLQHVGMDKVQVVKESLVIPNGMALDWGGIAKGYGVDLVSQRLKSMGVSRGFVNAGGDLSCWGLNPDRLPWKIGIKHPRKRGFLGILEISGLAAATTGDYQRFFEENGIRYHHVFDPQTGFPALGKQSVTVIGQEALLCDALSTALFVSKDPDSILEKYPGYGAILVDSEGRLSFLGKSFPFRPL